MSLKKAAEQVRKAGRGADTELVHFTKGEVSAMQGLAKAAGGKLTRNPETGMMEAGFLRSMLPTILGFAANFVVPGSGMIAGGLAGAATNKEDPLMGAFMGGLGGYGGGSLAAGLGTTAANTAAGAAANIAAPGAGAVATGAGSQAAQLAAQQAGFGQQGLNMLSQSAGVAPSAAAMGTAQAGLGAAAANPSSYISAMGGNKAALQAAGMAAAPALMMQPEQQPEEEQGEIPGYDYEANPTGNYYGSDGDNSTRQRQYFNPTFTRRMAEGGETDAAAGMSGASADALRYLMGQTSASNMPAMQQGIAQGVQQPTAPATPADPSKQYMYDTATNSVIRNPGYVDPAAAAAAVTASRSQNFSQPDYYYQAAQGGLLPLAKGGMASGGFVVPADVVAMVGEGNTDAGYRGIRTLVPEAVAIKGRDGGQADTVKTSIDGKQPARVAHGEMYLPPEAVKRMGGAQKLYAMMDRVRAQATGSTKQMKPVSLKRAMS